jgi:transglutaminase-like putative cysteine protease
MSKINVPPEIPALHDPVPPTAPMPVAARSQPVARYGVIHQTDYNYQSVVTLSQQYLHLTPRNFIHQQTVSHQIQVDPTPEDACGGFDYFANSTRKLTVTVPHQMLIVRAESVVEVFARPTLQEVGRGAPWEELQAAMCQSLGAADLDPYQYLYNSPHIQCTAALRDYALASFTPGRPLLEAAFELTCRISDDFEFDPDATNIHTTLDEVMQGRRGVCQDFAHLMIGCLRAIGLPARYVSGYILTHPPEGQARLIGADASHAWASLWSPVFGWVDFDPTNRCLVQHEHITLGWGRDYSDVTPLRGIVLGGGTQLLGVSVTVTPITQVQKTLI